MITFPENPTDGQTVVDKGDGNTIVIWTYDAAENQWNAEQYGAVGAAHITYTDQVLSREPDDAVVTQRDINRTQPEVAKATAANYANSVWMQADAAMQVRSSGIWINEEPDHIGAAPNLQRFYLAKDDGEPPSYKEATTAYVHQFGSGDLIDGGLEEVGDILQIYGPPRLDSPTPTHGVYRITSVERIGDGTSGYDTFGLEFLRGYGAPLHNDQAVIKSGPDTTSSGGGGGGGDYLPLTGGVMKREDSGGYLLEARQMNDNQLFSIFTSSASTSTSDAVEYFKAPADVTKPFEIVNRTYISANYLSLAGGTMRGTFSMGGNVLTAVGDPKQDGQAANKRYVDEQIASVGGGLGFTEKYNGNRYYKPGVDTTSLAEGEVMFLAGGATTEVFAAVTHVGLPEAGIDWTKFTRTGTIEVKNGSTLCGHLQVVSATNNAGRNWLVKVKMLDIISNELDPESGHPCYFWGMFTG